MKQRLVGTLVLGSLALIFIPILLDGDGVKLTSLSNTMPPAPVINRDPLPEPVRPDILSDFDSVLVTDETFAEPVATGEESATLPGLESETGDTEIPASVAQDAPVTQVAAELSEAASTLSEPQLNAQGLPDAWTIRLGIFADMANAEKLVNTLLSAGHKAYLRPFQSTQGSLSAVYVGPVVTRGEADSLQEQLASTYKLNGIVQKFEIGAAQ